MVRPPGAAARDLIRGPEVLLSSLKRVEIKSLVFWRLNSRGRPRARYTWSCRTEILEISGTASAAALFVGGISA